MLTLRRNNDYKTGNLIDYEYFSKDYKKITINLSKQIELENLELKQQINCIGTLAEECPLSLKNQKKELRNFHKLCGLYKTETQ